MEEEMRMELPITSNDTYQKVPTHLNSTLIYCAKVCFLIDYNTIVNTIHIR